MADKPFLIENLKSYTFNSKDPVCLLSLLLLQIFCQLILTVDFWPLNFTGKETPSTLVKVHCLAESRPKTTVNN